MFDDYDTTLCNIDYFNVYNINAKEKNLNKVINNLN